MLAETLVALAAAGGAAVVQAAGTDAWEGLRSRLARWFGRGNAESESRELERLDRSADDLATLDDGEATQVRVRQEAAWQARIEALLESLGDGERERAAQELRALLEETGRRSAGGEGVHHNTFHGNTAFQVGDGNRQDNRFGPPA
ncbi:hypothetical protein STRCI_007297 [Streptomyces cinnabarinus]|uniref:Uncharacterized protein n=1 Tax=Streptomyces cinnabarinus TaxID=67287 RepID=A0ABY7KN56_9ACTN|nr:hypothetical protein [Streptomyces cinnabarinus]WAZ25779.1 hypothetical protein STRCI_007297 [Streptomyces cinnabarinus]